MNPRETGSGPEAAEVGDLCLAVLALQRLPVTQQPRVTLVGDAVAFAQLLA